MTRCLSYQCVKQRGIVLVSSLLLLLVVTILALAMFRGFGIQEKIAGNTKEKQRALQAAETAQQYAEQWLSSPGNATAAPTTCVDLLSANTGKGQICKNKLPDIVNGVGNIAKLSWQVNGADVGVTYKPPGMVSGDTTSADNYANPPRFYISDMGSSADPTSPGEVFQVDAVGYGGSASTAAVVESTYVVYATSHQL
jgi:type IV pilus assembly protein PilX